MRQNSCSSPRAKKYHTKSKRRISRRRGISFVKDFDETYKQLMNEFINIETQWRGLVFSGDIHTDEKRVEDVVMLLDTIIEKIVNLKLSIRDVNLDDLVLAGFAPGWMVFHA